MSNVTQFYQTLLRQAEQRRPFAVATVVAVHGSASAEPGSKAIISAEGRNLLGWVGGGCVESQVIQEALQAITTAEARVIHVDLNDEVFGAGMPCGGSMEIYVEPFLPAERVLVLGDGETSKRISQWTQRAGFDVAREADGSPSQAEYVIAGSGIPTTIEHTGLVAAGLLDHVRSPAEEAASLTARLLSQSRSCSGAPLWLAKQMPQDTQPLQPAGDSSSPLVVVGHNRITEELAALAVAMDWEVIVSSPAASDGNYPQPVCRVLDDDAYELAEVTPRAYLVIATQHKGDHRILESVLPRRPAYVGLIASRTRAELIFEFLRRVGLLEAARACLHAPCGLDLGARRPFEIALSIVCEMIQHRNHAS